MSRYGAFDIIGPRMIGPSSSHTAGAVKLANMAWRIADRDVVRAKLTLFGSFAETGKGHGTDKALVAGLLGMDSADDRLRFSMLLAEEAGIKVDIEFSTEEREYANSVAIETESSTGRITRVEGASIGGGNVLLLKLGDMPVRITGEYPTLIVHYEDGPGRINLVTAVLAGNGVNIAFMQVFRRRRGTEACMVIETDGAVPAELQTVICNLSDKIFEVCAI